MTWNAGPASAGITGRHAWNPQKTDLKEPDQQSVLELLVVIGLKFISIWTHDQRYASRENELITDTKAHPVDKRKNEPMRIATAQELYIEFDGFLVQVKSVLDHMINILHYTLDLDFAALSTFGDKGNKIIALLRNNVNKKVKGRKECADLLITAIADNRWWLAVVIDARDRMNHFMHGGLSPAHFTVSYVIEADGSEKLYRPMMSPERTVKDEMTTILLSLMDFVEYFIGIAFACRMMNWAIQFNRRDDVNVPHWDVIPGSVVEELWKRGELKTKETVIVK